MATALALARASRSVPNADNLTVPLLGGDDDTSTDNKGCFSFSCCVTYLLGTILSAAWGFEYTLYGGVITLLGALFGITFSMFFAYASVKNASMASVNESNNQMRKATNEINKNVSAQAGFTDSLEEEAARLAELNQQLAMIAKTQGTNVEMLQSLVKRNKVALNEMTRITKAKLVQKLVELVIEGDKNGDFVIDENEAMELYLRLKNFRPDCIKVNETNFMKAIEENKGELKGIMEIVKEITDNVPIDETKRIFHIDENLGQGISKKKEKK